MNKGLQAAIFLVVAAVAGLGGYYFGQDRVSAPVPDAAAKTLLNTPLTDLNGQKRTLAHWSGKIVVVNFWATWCPPCREEIPELKKVHYKYVANGVELVGIALDDATKVRKYADEMGIAYSLLLAGSEALALGGELGNRQGVLPYTVVLDRAGKVVYTHAGALTESALDAILVPML